jgi:signal transduction histidine kinase
MKGPMVITRHLLPATRWVLSAPLFFKIMGIGLVVAAVFGSVTLIQVYGSVSRTLHQVLEQRARSMARSLAASLERPMSTGDLFSVDQRLRRTRRMFPDARYIIVRDAKGQVVSHTFEKAVPADLLDAARTAVASDADFQVFSSHEGLIFDVACPILDGHAGTVQLGVTNQMIARELAVVTRTIFWSLVLCALIGAGLALLLTHILTRPIHQLVQAANRIGSGDFDTRAKVFSGDEVGRLAIAFNRMARGLQGYRNEVLEKEKARVSLIERIVHVQEEERKSISRELHDQLGQSLLALLLAVQSICKENDVPQDLCGDIENRIRQLIDEVGRLAWGMRPSILDDYGLDSALARHVEEVSSHCDLVIDYQYTCSPGLQRLPSQTEVTLYRIAQEAIGNVVRHARAMRASAVLFQRQETVTLLVEDNGRGFDIESKQKDGASCFGLTGMKERAALLGGTCAVESVPGQGTTIRVTIPLSESETC